MRTSTMTWAFVLTCLATAGLWGCSSESDPCVPDCAGRECGLDPLCGESCGDCLTGESCDAQGACQPGCTPDCTGKQCGSDGCQGSCGTCQGGETCDVDQCVAAAVVLDAGHSGWQNTSCSGCHTLADLPTPPHDASWNGADCAACHGANGACDARGHQTGNDCTNCHNSRHGYSARADCVACHQNTVGGLANCP